MYYLVLLSYFFQLYSQQSRAHIATDINWVFQNKTPIILLFLFIKRICDSFTFSVGNFLKLKEAMTLIVMNTLKRVGITELYRPHNK